MRGDTQSSPASTEAPQHVMLVVRDEREGAAVRTQLSTDYEEAHVLLVSNLAEAFERLNEQPGIEGVVVDHDLPDGNSLDFLNRISAAKHDLPSVVLLPREGDGEKEAVEVMKSGAADYVRRSNSYLVEISFKLKEAVHHHRLAKQVQEMAEHREQMRLIRNIHGTVATVKHEINNPLSIISGNAQLLRELARALELGDEIAQPARDIEEASQRIASSLDKLENLKDIIIEQFGEAKETKATKGTGEG